MTGFSIGDGNLTNPNGRATRLRVTCDKKYPELKNRIVESLRILFPENRVSEYVRKENCTDVYCYSNKLESILGWRANMGSKYEQNVTVPLWIFSDRLYIKNCLKGLFETDGSIYKDRKYTYINFTTIIERLKNDVLLMIEMMGYKAKWYKIFQKKGGKYKYVIRIAKNARNFIDEIGINKK